MKCNCCGSVMTLDRSESGQSSSSEWYQCSLCGKVRLTCSKLSLGANPDYSYNTDRESSYPETVALTSGTAVLS